MSGSGLLPGRDRYQTEEEFGEQGASLEERNTSFLWNSALVSLFGLKFGNAAAVYVSVDGSLIDSCLSSQMMIQLNILAEREPRLVENQ